jgi:hypothetical protein
MWDIAEDGSRTKRPELQETHKMDSMMEIQKMPMALKLSAMEESRSPGECLAHGVNTTSGRRPQQTIHTPANHPLIKLGFEGREATKREWMTVARDEPAGQRIPARSSSRVFHESS